MLRRLGFQFVFVFVVHADVRLHLNMARNEIEATLACEPSDWCWHTRANKQATNTGPSVQARREAGCVAGECGLGPHARTSVGVCGNTERGQRQQSNPIRTVTLLIRRRKLLSNLTSVFPPVFDASLVSYSFCSPPPPRLSHTHNTHATPRRKLHSCTTVVPPPTAHAFDVGNHISNVGSYNCCSPFRIVPQLFTCLASSRQLPSFVLRCAIPRFLLNNLWSSWDVNRARHSAIWKNPVRELV